MNKVFLCCILLFLGLDARPTVCLNMIIKNESEIITRCLESVKPYIDYWVICDTGSEDGTQSIAMDCMSGIPGQLYERPWVHFEHNRNEALELAKNCGDYVLFIDADEILVAENGFQLPELNKDFYYITTQLYGTEYARVQLINNHINWRWVGWRHEVIVSNEISSWGSIYGIYNVPHTDGARSKDPEKFIKDAEVLEQELLTRPNEPRVVFYIAQSYKDGGNYEFAEANYEKRVAMKGWDQEVFWSMLQIGLLQEMQNKSSQTILKAYYNAYNFRPSRLEPLYRAASYLRRSGNYLEGYYAAHQGLKIPLSKDQLFVEKWIYDYGLLLEYSICAYWIGKYSESLLASYLILANRNIPQNVKECVQNNLVWINEEMDKTNGWIKNREN